MHRCVKLTYHVVGVLPVCFLGVFYGPAQQNSAAQKQNGAILKQSPSSRSAMMRRRQIEIILYQLLAHACWCSRVSKCLLQEPLQPPKATSKRSSGQKSRGLNSKLSSGSITFRYKLPAAFRWTFSNGKRLPTARKVTLREVPVVPVMKRMFLRWLGAGVGKQPRL